MNFSSSRYFNLIELEEGSLGGPFCRVLMKGIIEQSIQTNHIKLDQLRLLAQTRIRLYIKKFIYSWVV
ncbi:hypothetical protein BpHYR1_054566 [Brachionus plicatilis]|uniref:Uncharacterized protein n=1 Tax=Brachionus plicatilis TaxID=10195 RepID=A0A3M7PWV3_BRAPC|nr:hypothetical protein BpHYR1_054566 [Brachionus plicatilis]